MRTEHEDAIRCEVVARLFDRRIGVAAHPGGRPLAEVINETLYHERERLRQPGGSHEPETEKSFYSEIRRELPRANEVRQKELLRTILERYTREITGHFNELVYGVATRAVPLALSGLLSGLSPLKMAARGGRLPALDDRIVVQGDTGILQRLVDRGTLVFVPTHSSNLDSVIMGHTIYRLGLPPVTYGAGLNLFSNPIVGFFMRNLGAYTVDRRKSDPLYRETLKEYAGVTMEFGYHNLFFPGGTRSRSNRVEGNIKKGLLGTTLSAFSHNVRAGKMRPNIYVVPVTISYPLVLEAKTLIDDHFQRAGKARYIIEDDEFSKVRRWVDFLRGLMAMEQRIYVTFAPPLDPMGNRVAADGTSLDPRGRTVDPAAYLQACGCFVDDPVRDTQYTEDLADQVVESYYNHTVAFPTNLVAFAVLHRLRGLNGHTDLYRFLRSLSRETNVPISDVEADVEALLAALRQGGRRPLLDRVLAGGDVRQIVRDALRSYGTYHTTPVLRREGIRLYVGDANLMVYYSNRLRGYGLEEVMAGRVA